MVGVRPGAGSGMGKAVRPTPRSGKSGEKCVIPAASAPAVRSGHDTPVRPQRRRTSSARWPSVLPTRFARSRPGPAGPSTSSTPRTRRWRPRCRSSSAPSTCCSATSRTRSRPTTRWPRVTGWSPSPRATDFGPDPAVDPGQRPRQPVGARRPDHPRLGDRRQARRGDGAEGPGRRGHRVRRPVARPARGQGRSRPADPRARDPRDGPRCRERRGDLRRLAPHAGAVARAGRPGRGPTHEDHARRRRTPGVPGASGPDARRRTASRPPTGRPTSRTCGTTRSRAWSTRARCTASRRTTARSATSATRSRARTSSATPSCWGASARGACTPRRSRSPNASSRRPSRTSRMRAAWWPPCNVTGATARER